MAQDSNNDCGGQEPPLIPGHELIRLIGRGSYGTIFMARSSLGALRAVKVVSRSTFSNDRPFEREYVGVRLYEPVSREHPGLVDVLQVGREEKNGFFYYVMELADDVDGGTGKIAPEDYRPRTLATTMASRGRIPACEVIDWGIAIAEALDFLHVNKLVHRDIKPSNIIFVGGVPKIADLGLVGVLDGRNSFVGTDGFFPPEGPGSSRADIFALGKVLYEAATGKDRLDFPELPTRLGEGPDDPLVLELNQVLVTACDPDPGKRFSSAADMARALREIKGGKSLVEVRRQQARRRAFAGSVGVMMSMGLVAWFLNAIIQGVGKTAPDMISARQSHTATVLEDGRVMVAGGYARVHKGILRWTMSGLFDLFSTGSGMQFSSAKTLADAEVFDPMQLRWTRVEPMHEPRYYHAAVRLPGGKVLVAGGYRWLAGKDSWIDTAELFDPQTGSWTSAGKLSEARSS